MTMPSPALRRGKEKGQALLAERCTERATLSRAVSNAITEEYLRKKAYQDARTKGDPIVLWAAAFQNARDALAKAVDASSKHIEDHGCKK